MKFYKIFHYAYLVFAALFIYDGISKWNKDPDKAYISLGLGALAIFIFFFRKRFSKKFENRDNSK